MNKTAPNHGYKQRRATPPRTNARLPARAQRFCALITAAVARLLSAWSNAPSPDMLVPTRYAPFYTACTRQPLPTISRRTGGVCCKLNKAPPYPA